MSKEQPASWKNQKFETVLGEIRSGFEKESVETLQGLIDTIPDSKEEKEWMMNNLTAVMLSEEDVKKAYAEARKIAQEIIDSKAEKVE